MFLELYFLCITFVNLMCYLLIIILCSIITNLMFIELFYFFLYVISSSTCS